MRFDPRFLLAGGAVCVSLLLLPATSEAALAKKLGSKYGGTLSTNKSISTQQLTADPASILQGSMSTEYDPSLVSLEQLIPNEFFHVSALVGVFLPGDPVERFVTDTAFFGGLPAGVTESGYLQVSFQRFAGFDQQASIATLPGYVVVDADGETDGDETHALIFQSITDNPDAVASYHIYQEDGTNHAVVPTVGALAMAGAGVLSLRRRRRR